MINRYDHGGITWIDVERPTIDEVEGLVEEFKFGPMVEQEILTPTAKPRIDVFPSFVYTVFHFPASRDTRGAQDTHEVDLIVTQNLVVSVHYDTIPAILDFARSFEAAMLLKRTNKELHSGHILFELSERLYRSVEDELDAMEDSVAKVQNAIFEGKEKELVRPISILTRELLNHKRIIANQDTVLHEFENASLNLFGEHFKAYIAGMSALHFRVQGRAHMLLDTLSELRDTNNSLLTTKQNETMKNLTIVASVLLPMTLIAGLFGMNTENNPLVGNPFDFWLVVAIMILVGVVTALYLRTKKWF